MVFIGGLYQSTEPEEIDRTSIVLPDIQLSLHT